MKKIILFSCFYTVGSSLYCQITIPSKLLRESIRKIDTARLGSALTLDTNINDKFYWFPSIKYMDVFEKQKTYFFQKNIVGYNDSLSNVSLYSEIASDFLGPVRVSTGITLAYPKTDTNSVKQQKINREKFVQRFSTGGGAVVFNFVLPLFAYYGKAFGTSFAAGPRFALDPPSFGISSGEFVHNTALGSDLQVQLNGIKNVFTFYGAARLSYVDGNSAFYNALGLVDKDRAGFWLNNYMIGVNVKEIFTISYTKFWGSKSIKDRLSGFLTFTVEPNFQ
ncbi:MAG: hypothetical protein ACXVMS_07075 [Flavisolibacter sp.]